MYIYVCWANVGYRITTALKIYWKILIQLKEIIFFVLEKTINKLGEENIKSLPNSVKYIQ